MSLKSVVIWLSLLFSTPGVITWAPYPLFENTIYDYTRPEFSKSIQSLNLGNAEDFRNAVFEVCRYNFAGAWNVISAKQMRFYELSRSLKDRWYYCGLPFGLKPFYREYGEAAVIFYGPGRRHPEDMKRVATVHAYFSQKQAQQHSTLLTPRILGNFPGGRIEEYWQNARIAQKSDLPFIAKEVFRKLAYIHGLNPPLPRSIDLFWHQISTFLSLTKSAQMSENTKKHLPNERLILAQILHVNLEAEAQWLRNYLDELQVPIVFSHGYTRLHQIYLRKYGKPDYKLTFLDLGWGQYMYRTYDLADFIVEAAIEINGVLPYPHFMVDNNVMPTPMEMNELLLTYLQSMTHLERDWPKTVDTVETLAKEMERTVLLSHFYNGIQSLFSSFYDFGKVFGFPEYSKTRFDMYFKFKEQLIQKEGLNIPLFATNTPHYQPLDRGYPEPNGPNDRLYLLPYVVPCNGNIISNNCVTNGLDLCGKPFKSSEDRQSNRGPLVGGMGNEVQTHRQRGTLKSPTENLVQYNGMDERTQIKLNQNKRGGPGIGGTGRQFNHGGQRVAGIGVTGGQFNNGLQGGVGIGETGGQFTQGGQGGTGIGGTGGQFNNGLQGGAGIEGTGKQFNNSPGGGAVMVGTSGQFNNDGQGGVGIWGIGGQFDNGPQGGAAIGGTVAQFNSGQYGGAAMVETGGQFNSGLQGGGATGGSGGQGGAGIWGSGGLFNSGQGGRAATGSTGGQFILGPHGGAVMEGMHGQIHRGQRIGVTLSRANFQFDQAKHQSAALSRAGFAGNTNHFNQGGNERAVFVGGKSHFDHTQSKGIIVESGQIYHANQEGTKLIGAGLVGVNSQINQGEQHREVFTGANNQIFNAQGKILFAGSNRQFNQGEKGRVNFHDVGENFGQVKQRGLTFGGISHHVKPIQQIGATVVNGVNDQLHQDQLGVQFNHQNKVSTIAPGLQGLNSQFHPGQQAGVVFRGADNDHGRAAFVTGTGQFHHAQQAERMGIASTGIYTQPISNLHQDLSERGAVFRQQQGVIALPNSQFNQAQGGAAFSGGSGQSQYIGGVALAGDNSRFNLAQLGRATLEGMNRQNNQAQQNGVAIANRSVEIAGTGRLFPQAHLDRADSTHLNKQFNLAQQSSAAQVNNLNLVVQQRAQQRVSPISESTFHKQNVPPTSNSNIDFSNILLPSSNQQTNKNYQGSNLAPTSKQNMIANNLINNPTINSIKSNPSSKIIDNSNSASSINPAKVASAKIEPGQEQEPYYHPPHNDIDQIFYDPDFDTTYMSAPVKKEVILADKPALDVN